MHGPDWAKLKRDICCEMSRLCRVDGDRAEPGVRLRQQPLPEVVRQRQRHPHRHVHLHDLLRGCPGQGLLHGQARLHRGGWLPGQIPLVAMVYALNINTLHSGLG